MRYTNLRSGVMITEREYLKMFDKEIEISLSAFDLDEKAGCEFPHEYSKYASSESASDYFFDEF